MVLKREPVVLEGGTLVLKREPVVLEGGTLVVKRGAVVLERESILTCSSFLVPLSSLPAQRKTRVLVKTRNCSWTGEGEGWSGLENHVSVSNICLGVTRQRGTSGQMTIKRLNSRLVTRF